MCLTTIHRDRTAGAGFTLVETLVALVVLAISLTAIGALASSNLRSGLYLERHLSAVETAREIEAGLPGRSELMTGSSTGELADHQWRVDAGPFAADFIDAKAPTAWSPQKIIIRVQGPTGELLQIDTIRLRKRAAR